MASNEVDMPVVHGGLLILKIEVNFMIIQKAILQYEINQLSGI